MLRSGVLFALFLFGVSFIVQAQHNGKTYKRPRKIAWTMSDRFVVTLTPSSLLDPYGALLPLGLGYYFGEQYSVHFEAGFPLYYVLNNAVGQPQKTVNSDFKLRTDIRQYFRLREKNRCFFGAESAFRNQEMYLKDGYLHYVNGANYDYARVNATKTVYCLGVFAGTSRKLSERFMLETHLGLGLRFLKMKTDFNTTGLTPVTKNSFVSLFPPNEDRIGDQNLNIYLPFAIKIGYLF